MEESKKEYSPPKGSTKDGRLGLGKGVSLEYTAHADWIILRKKEKPAAEIFHVAYLQKGKSPGKRPLTFVFNGGPGAASAYLHLGALGPERALFHPKGAALPPPVKLVHNPESWLDFTDLVFVDPVGTGFSRAVEKDAGKGKPESGDKQPDEKGKPEETEFFGLKRDLESLGEFMQKCLSRYGRWESPIFVAGESYGGFRAAKLARLAQQDYGIGLNGAVIISPALEFAALDHSDYDVLPWINGFPTMAAAAAFHGRSKAFPGGADVDTVLREAEAFTTGELTRLLAAGSLRDERERERIYGKMARFLGLPLELIRRNGGRISAVTFGRNLLKDQRRMLGLYDATVTVVDPYPDRDSFEGPDPTLYGIDRVFTAGINAHLRSNLGLETDRDYHLLSMEVNRAWKIDMERHALDSHIGATDDLRYGMVLNPFMKVFLTHGIYDMVTPYFSANRIIANMKLDPSTSGNLQVRHFKGGHMFYVWDESRQTFHSAVKGFFRGATSKDRSG